jgi:hypothetical protein
MALWRIRIRLSDDPHSRAQLDSALTGLRVKDMTFAPREEGSAEMAGDVVLELTQDEDLGSILSALHRISPQVFVSRADDDQAASKASGGPSLTKQFRRLTRPTASSRAAD